MVVNAENPANARFISKYRPSVNVIAFASDDQVCNNLNTMRNIFPVKVASNKKEDAEKNMKAAIETAKRVNVIKAEGKYIQVNFEVTGHDVKTL
jgi:pyruvate kinase